jgi:hypothetical protein
LDTLVVAVVSAGISRSASMRHVVMALTLVLAACGGSSAPTSPSAATPPVTPAPVPTPTPTTSTVSGSLVATNGGQPLGGVSVSIPGQAPLVTDAPGQFSFSVPLATATAALELSGAAIVPRRLTLATRTRAVSVDAIQLAGGFSLPFYRQLVRNGFEQPGTLQPLRRWTENPRVYLRTVFGAGRAFDTGSLDVVAAAVGTAVGQWSGGRLSVATVERGTDTREGVPGWITVVWSEELGERTCGRAVVAGNPGRIQLHPRNDGCRCPGDPGQVSTSVVVHEVGHAMGFWHTDDREDAMFDTFNSCRAALSARERLHAAVAYARPPGNTDPDADPTSAVLSVPTGATVR